MTNGHLVVLCVDDDPDTQLLVELSLALDGDVELHQSLSSNAAWMKIENGLRPDVVLLDDELSDLCITNFAQRLGQLRSDKPCKIICLSGACRSSGLLALQDAGAIGVIAKPFNPRLLVGDIRNIILRSRPFYISI